MILAGDVLHWPGAPNPPAAIVNLAEACRESVIPLDAVLARRQTLIAEGAASRREQAEVEARPRRYRSSAPAPGGRCVVCGREIPPRGTGRGRPRVTCSAECSTARNREREAARRRDVRARDATRPLDPAEGYGSLRVVDRTAEAGAWQDLADGFTVERVRD